MATDVAEHDTIPCPPPSFDDVPDGYWDALPRLEESIIDPDDLDDPWI
jgi:hypothetical protein